MGNAQPRQPRYLLKKGPSTEIAITCGDVTLRWNEIEERACRLANAIEAAGVGPGEAWAILAHNRVEWPEVLMANARAGTRVVLLNWHLAVPELVALLEDSAALLLVVDEALAAQGVEAAAQAGLETVVTMGDRYQGWLNEASPEPPTERSVGSPMLFTGGTTGRSKGVNRSDQVALAGAWAALPDRWGTMVCMPEEGTTLITTPLYHAFGQGVMNASLAKGMPLIVHERFDAEATLRTIERCAITCAPMVPTQFIRMLKLDEETKTRYDLSSIEWVLHTAAPCPEWAKRAMIDWWGPVIYEMYGSSEGAGPAICDSEEWLAHPGTVGKASARLEYSIVDDDGNTLGPGEIGTIYCKRVDGTPSYHGAADKTAEMTLPDGRFTVGDLGWLDEDGFLFLADRRVDLIITGGANVYPAEIEAALVQHHLVADVAVFGVPDPEWGASVKAVVEPVAGAKLDLDELAHFSRGLLAGYKVPKIWEIADQLPREAHGKLKKRLLS